MASVKWLCAIEAIDRPFDGLQQARSYHFRRESSEPGEPCTLMRVNSLMAPPGIPDFYSRKRSVPPGNVTIRGRAWSGSAPIARVELGVDGRWTDAVLEPAAHAHAWTAWHATWPATPGEHELSCRATDASGNTQPLEPPWDLSGFGNNAVQRIHVSVNAAAR
jgi:sulfane dehydrogenase subunit SoxC